MNIKRRFGAHCIYAVSEPTCSSAAEVWSQLPHEFLEVTNDPSLELCMTIFMLFCSYFLFSSFFFFFFQIEYKFCNGSDKECVSPTAKFTKKETLKVCAKQACQHQLTFFYKSGTFQTNHWELFWVISQVPKKPLTLLGVILCHGH